MYRPSPLVNDSYIVSRQLSYVNSDLSVRMSLTLGRFRSGAVVRTTGPSGKTGRVHEAAVAAGSRGVNATAVSEFSVHGAFPPQQENSCGDAHRDSLLT